MNDILLLGSAIYNYLNTNGTIPTYFAQAPQNTNTPYCVVMLMDASDEYTFNDAGVDSIFNIKVISNRQLPLEAIQLYGTVHELIQDAPITSNDFTTLQCRRADMYLFQDDADNWNVGGMYDFDIWK